MGTEEEVCDAATRTPRLAQTEGGRSRPVLPSLPVPRFCLRQRRSGAPRVTDRWLLTKGLQAGLLHTRLPLNAKVSAHARRRQPLNPRLINV